MYKYDKVANLALAIPDAYRHLGPTSRVLTVCSVACMLCG